MRHWRLTQTVMFIYAGSVLYFHVHLPRGEHCSCPFCYGLLVDFTVSCVIIAWDALWEFMHLSRHLFIYLFFFSVLTDTIQDRWSDVRLCVVWARFWDVVRCWSFLACQGHCCIFRKHGSALNGSRKCQKLHNSGRSKMVGCLEGEEEGMWSARPCWFPGH